MTKTNKTFLTWFSWAMISGAILISPNLVQADGTTTTTTHCSTNSYGQETCYDTTTTKEDKPTTIAYVDEHVIVTPEEVIQPEPHEVLDTALTPAQTISLAIVLCLGLVALTLKFKTQKA